MDKPEQQKQECQVLLEEYKRLTNEISKRLDYCDKNINYQFILLGIVATAITTIIAKKEGIENYELIIKYILLFSPVVFYILGFYYSINNMFILKIGQYITDVISDRMRKLLDTQSLLSFEEYFQKKVLKDKNRNTLVATVVLHWTLSIPLILLGSYAVFSVTEGLKLSSSEIVLLLLNVILIALSIKANIEQEKIIDSQPKRESIKNNDKN